jgi:hypothetical protein
VTPTSFTLASLSLIVTARWLQKAPLLPYAIWVTFGRNCSFPSYLDCLPRQPASGCRATQDSGLKQHIEEGACFSVKCANFLSAVGCHFVGDTANRTIYWIVDAIADRLPRAGYIGANCFVVDKLLMTSYSAALISNDNN